MSQQGSRLNRIQEGASTSRISLDSTLHQFSSTATQDHRESGLQRPESTQDKYGKLFLLVLARLEREITLIVVSFNSCHLVLSLSLLIRYIEPPYRSFKLFGFPPFAAFTVAEHLPPLSTDFTRNHFHFFWYSPEIFDSGR